MCFWHPATTSFLRFESPIVWGSWLLSSHTPTEMAHLCRKEPTCATNGDRSTEHLRFEDQNVTNINQIVNMKYAILEHAIALYILWLGECFLLGCKLGF